MNNAENIARLTDGAEQQNEASARNLAPSSESSILDAQSILDGAYNELVQSGTVEAGKAWNGPKALSFTCAHWKREKMRRENVT